MCARGLGVYVCIGCVCTRVLGVSVCIGCVRVYRVCVCVCVMMPAAFSGAVERRCAGAIVLSLCHHQHK